jgi:hypothetical protein
MVFEQGLAASVAGSLKSLKSKERANGMPGSMR